MIAEIIITNLIVAGLTGNSSIEFPKSIEFNLNNRIVNAHTAQYQELENRLNSHNPKVKIKAINTVAEKKINKAFNHLLWYLNDEDYRIRGITAIALGKLGNEDAIPFLITALKDEHHGVRGSAALSLGRLNATYAEDNLIEALNDQNPTVILSASYSLGIINSKKSIKPIIKLLAHDHPQIRENAAWVLGLLKAKEALPYLEAIIQDTDEKVRISVKKAIFHIKYSILSDTTAIKYSGGNGSNIENAIKITGIKNSLACLKSQKDFIKSFYGQNTDWEQVNQYHVEHDNKHYNLITIKEKESGTIRKFYFDITELFSKL